MATTKLTKLTKLQQEQRKEIKINLDKKLRQTNVQLQIDLLGTVRREPQEVSAPLPRCPAEKTICIGEKRALGIL